MDDGRWWDVTLDTGERRRYAGVVICNGHNWEPKYPDYPGEFTGATLHSSEYKTPDALEGKRVLVVGAGNSGCDIAAESAQHATRTLLSTRRGYYYMPKYFFGRPVDQVGERLLDLGFPLALRRVVGRLTYRMAVGDLEPIWGEAAGPQALRDAPHRQRPDYHTTSRTATSPPRDIREYRATR